MDAQLVEPAAHVPTEFDAIDFAALQAYLALYVQNLRSLSNVSRASFGALGSRAADFHVQARVSDAGAVSFAQIEQVDQRILLMIDTARARLHAPLRTQKSLRLVFFRVECSDTAGSHLALISLGLQDSATAHSYQIFEVTSQADLAGILAGPSLSAMHQVSHFLLWRHFGFRSNELPRQAAKRPTERQLQIVELLAAGLSDKQIARQLDLSQHTVRNVVRRLLTKYGMRKRIQLCRLASATTMVS